MRSVALIFILLIIYSLKSFAEIPVDIKADNLKYYEESGLIEASGSVEVKLKDATIFADWLKIDSQTKVTTAEGHVRLLAKDYTSDSGALFYDAENETARFTDYKGRFSPSNMKGYVYLTAKDMVDLKKEMKGNLGSATTCDEPAPHYFLRADQLGYFPNDHIEGQNATLYVGELPVFWTPYLYYDLHEQLRRNWAFGHNDVEGDFIKSSWAYPAGVLLLDLMAKKGVGVGTQSNDLYLYGLGEKDTGTTDLIEKLNRKGQLGLTTVSLRHSYISTYQLPAGRLEQTTFGLDLTGEKGGWNLGLGSLDDRNTAYSKYNLQFNRAFGKTSTNYSLNYEFSKNSPTWLRNSQRFGFATPLWSDSVMFNSSAAYYHSTTGVGDSGQEKIEPQFDITGRAPGFSWRYSENRFIDLKQSDHPNETRYEFLEKKPEIEIDPSSLDLKLFTLSPSFGYGNYREVRYVPALGKNRDYTTARTHATLNANRNVALGLGTLSLGAGLDQFLYGPGDQLYALRENAGLHSDNTKFFRNDVNFRQGYSDGNTPFLFDQLGTKYHDLTEQMTFYHLNNFSWTTTGGLNWQTNKWFDVMTNLMYTPDQKSRLTLNTGWDIENRMYKDLVCTLHLAPATYYSTDLSFTQDMNLGQLRYGSALHDFYFLEGQPNQLHLRFSQVFDATTKEFKVRDIMVVKDLHCWEMQYTYSDYRKEFSIVFSLKAMPGEPVGFSTGRGFYYDGFERQLNQLNPTVGEVKRY